MTWRYKAARIKGNKQNPQRGDAVTIVLEDTSDAENVLTKELVYGFDGEKTKARFVAMVRAEVKAHILHLNTSTAEDDVTDVFNPD